MRRRHALLAASAATLPTWAQQTKTIRLIVPYPPGGPLDIAARALADQVKDTLGTVIVDNRPAQRLNIGSVRELVAYLKRNPAKINYGSGGNGSAGHLAGELFKTQAGVFMVHIPYGGGPGAQMGLLSGQVDLNFDNLAAASANIRSGKLKALAVTTARRSSAMPEVPTVAESGADLGLARFDIHTWFGLFGPAKLPPEVTARLNKAFVDALSSADVKARLAALMTEPAPSTAESFAQFVRAEHAKYETIVKASGAKAD